MRTRKWEPDALKLDALRFNTPTEWARGSSGAYSAANKLGLLDECCAHMQRKAKPLSKAAAFLLATQYSTPSSFKSAQPTAVRMLIRNGCLSEAQAHMVTSRRKLDKASVLASAAQYQTRRDWRTYDPTHSATARRKGWFDEAVAHMDVLRREPWTKDEVLLAASGFNHPTTFKDNCSGAWSVAQREGYLDEACSHMIRLAHKPSDQEQALFAFVSGMCPDAIQSDNNVLGGKQLDILIPSKGIAIEFNGLFWHSTRTGRDRNYHQAKSDAAAAAGYRLIHIWSDEWIEKQDIIKAYLRMQLVGPDRVIGARKCSIVPLPAEVALPFHRMFHLQGARGGEHFGLYHAGELLAVATVQGVELARWTVRFGTVVVGALSKMMKHLGRRSISYCDTAKHTGAGYIAAGFKQIGVAAPSYYYTDGNRRFNRIGFQKHKLLNRPGAQGNTEIELAASLGFHQVGGTRQLKFEIIT